jgi:hypothetical protein
MVTSDGRLCQSQIERWYSSRSIDSLRFVVPASSTGLASGNLRKTQEPNLRSRIFQALLLRSVRSQESILRRNRDDCDHYFLFSHVTRLPLSSRSADFFGDETRKPRLVGGSRIAIRFWVGLSTDRQIRHSF